MSEDQGPMPQGNYDRLEIERDLLKEELRTADKLLARIATVCTGALDPELTREQVVGRVKYIYSLAAFDEDGAEDVLSHREDMELADAPAGLAEGP